MATVYISSTAKSDNTISALQFGGNFLFNREYFGEGVGDLGGFDEVAQNLGVTQLRYPGGAIAETQFSLKNPDSSYQNINLLTGEVISNTKKYALTPLSDFLTFAQSIDGQVSIVLPTAQYREALLGSDTLMQEAAKSEIQKFVVDVLSGSLGDVVAAFEVGNEYYAAAGLSPTEYGRIASQMSVWIQDAIDVSGIGRDPIIAVQSGQQKTADNNMIIAEFSSDALDAVDAIIAHTYQTAPWESSNIEKKSSFLASWNDAKGADSDLDWMVTEWNVSSKAGDGLLQGAGILEMFNDLVRNGMDIGHIWPLLENTQTELAGDVTLGMPTELMVSGEVFRQMSSSLVGLQAIEMNTKYNVDADVESDVLVQIYESSSEYKLVTFVSSLDGEALEIDLDLTSFGDIVTGYDYLWGAQIGVLDGQNPINANSMPKVTPLMKGDIEGATYGDGIVSLRLDPYEIVRLEFMIGQGAEIYAHDQTSRGDVLVGSEFADEINGFLGNDTLQGGSGDDVVNGGGGDDVLHGNNGRDVLTGGDGDDRMLGGIGADTIFGNSGDDILRGGGGNDILSGGAGADIFIFYPTWDADVIVDFESDKDTIELRNFGFSDVDNALVMARQDGADVVFEFSDGDSLKVQNISIGELSGTISVRNDIAGEGIGTSGDDIYFGGGSDDFIFGGEGNDQLHGARGDDLLDGGDSDDRMFGGAGNDTLIGGAGNDTLRGGVGDDILTGGEDSDTFVFYQGWGSDRITDFQDGIDIIELRGFSSPSTSEVFAAASQVGSDVMFSLGGGDVLTIENTQIDMLFDDVFII